MKKPACEQLTLFPADSPASPFPWLESKKEKGMIVTYGQKCLELSGNLRQLGWLVRTYLESLELPLKRYYRIWKVQAIGRQSLIMKLRLAEHSTEGEGYSLWPTVTCMDSLPAKSKEGLTREMAVRPGRKMPNNIKDCVQPESMKLWPTPRAGICGMTASNSDRPKEKSTNLGMQVLLREKLYTTVCAAEAEGSTEGESPQPENGCRRTIEPGMGGMADGIPHWLDGEPAGIPRIVKGLPHRADRIKALGNAVVPQQAYPIFRAIRMIEEEI